MPYRQNFPIPAVIDPPKTCLQIEIPDHPDWKAVISGLLFELTYWFNWERTGDTSGAQCAAVWKKVYNSIDWSDMSCCCEEKAKIQRINPSTGIVEVSTDGGTTWQPAPGGLPSVIVQPVPPVASGVAATKCDAATNVREQCSQWVTQVTNDFDTAVTLLEFGELVIAAILGAVLTVLTGGGLAPLEVSILTALGAALAAAWGAGKAVFTAYWTTDKLDIILCNAYCNISDDGSFTDAQFSSFWTACNGELPPSPAKMLFMGFLSSVGAPGLNAMAASGFSADADCSDCACSDVCGLDWTVRPDITAYTEIIDVGDDYITVSAFGSIGGNYYGIVESSAIDVCCTFDHFEVLSGEVQLWAWKECNSDDTTTGLPTGHCMHQLGPQSAVPFIVKLFFVPC